MHEIQDNQPFLAPAKHGSVLEAGSAPAVIALVILAYRFLTLHIWPEVRDSLFQSQFRRILWCGLSSVSLLLHPGRGTITKLWLLFHQIYYRLLYNLGMHWTQDSSAVEKEGFPVPICPSRCPDSVCISLNKSTEFLFVPCSFKFNVLWCLVISIRKYNLVNHWRSSKLDLGPLIPKSPWLEMAAQ